MDGEPLAEVAATSADLLLALDGAEVFEVRAFDAAGNESEGLHALAPARALAPQDDRAAPAPRPPAPAARLTSLGAAGGARDVEAASARLWRRRLSIEDCYRRALAEGPLFAGHVELALEVDADGAVREARVVGASVQRPTLARCLRSVLRRADLGPGDPGPGDPRRLRARWDFHPAGLSSGLSVSPAPTAPASPAP